MMIQAERENRKSEPDTCDHRSFCQIDLPESSSCFSATAHSFFFKLSFFGKDSFGSAVAFCTVKTGNGVELVGNGDGGKTRDHPLAVLDTTSRVSNAQQPDSLRKMSL